MAGMGSGYGPIVFHADQELSAISVGQGNNLLINILIAYLLSVGLEFLIKSFTLSDHVFKLLRINQVLPPGSCQRRHDNARS